MRGGGRAVAWALCAVAVGMRPEPAHADDAAWLKVASPDRTVAETARDLDGVLASLDHLKITEGEVTAYAAKEDERTSLVARVNAALTLGHAALDAAGFSSAGFEHVSVVWVRAASGSSGAALSPSGRAVFYRERTTGVAPLVLAPLKPLDGPPSARAVAALDDRALALLDESASAVSVRAGPGSLSNAVARAFAAQVKLPEGTPAWASEGFVSWLEAAAFPEVAKVPLHVCGGPAGAKAALTAIKTLPTPSQARLLGLLVAALLEGAKDGPARFARFAASSDKGAKAAAEILGRDPAALMADAARPASGAAAAALRCDAAGTVPCPLCVGGKVDVACEACEGLGGVACPSCDGNNACGAAGCCDGEQGRGDGYYKCKMCYGMGFAACVTCGDKRFPCKVCGASGKTARACLLCRGRGRVGCPDGGVPPAAEETGPCPWCQNAPGKAACTVCGGSGFQGCRTCHGSGLVECPSCGGIGCKTCAGSGSRACPDGDGTKSKCAACKGAGTVALDPKRCVGCGGTGKAEDPARARLRSAERLRGVDAAERVRNGEVSAKAVRFLLGCAGSDGEFRLRDQRRTPDAELGALDKKATLFSNAQVLWALLAAHLPSDRAEVARALKGLEEAVVALIDDRAGKTTVQSVSDALRPLLMAGRKPDDPLVVGLVKRLVAAQRRGGHWGHQLDGTDAGDAFQSLCAVESLWLAQRRGAKVPASTWSRALAAGLKVSVLIPKSMKRGGFLTGTDVASNAALIVLAKAGGLGDKAKDLDEYRSIPQVQQALAWLDRHFDVQREPIVAGGAMVRGDGDGGYTTWLFSLQRLARLLSIDEFAGRRWYPEGCRRLARMQLADGGFEELHRGRLNGPVRTTSAALLFLERATPPLTGDSPDDETPADGR